MSQHDFNIANQGFPGFRSDLNNALEALATLSSGATEPATKFAYQHWVDTSTSPPTLKIRNGTNDGWISVTRLNSSTNVSTPVIVTQSTSDNSTNPASTAFVKSALQAIYPIGSIYINATSSTNPATLFGFGTWSLFGGGRVLVGFTFVDELFNSGEKTGGSKDAIIVSHTHTFSATTSNAGSHSHTQTNGTGGTSNSGTVGTRSNIGSFPDEQVTSTAGAHDHTVSGTTASTGSSGTNANLQPYITVFMWKRTA
jgi:hypothetical protein